MGKSKTKFQDSWLDEELDSVLIKEWLEAVSDIFIAKCILCSEIFFGTKNFPMLVTFLKYKGKKPCLKFANKIK